MNENTYRLIKSIFMAILLFLLYLYVLNGRYETVGNSLEMIIDKWGQELLMRDWKTDKYVGK